MVLLPLVCSKVERAGDRRRRHHRRAQHGGGLRARRRGRADGHPHGLLGREPGARELEGRDPRARRRPTRCSSTASAPARRCGRCAPRRPRAFEKAPPENIMREFGNAQGPLLRRRHGGLDRALRPGRRAHRRGEAGRPGDRRDGGRVRGGRDAELGRRFGADRRWPEAGDDGAMADEHDAASMQALLDAAEGGAPARRRAQRRDADRAARPLHRPAGRAPQGDRGRAERRLRLALAGGDRLHRRRRLDRPAEARQGQPDASG